MCSTEMRAAPLPATRAARMKSRVQSDSAAPRVSRAKTGTLKMPIAMMAFTAEGPKTAVIMMAISSAGKAKTRSLPRMMTSSSSVPRRAAAASPSGTPSPMPMPTATSATAIETRAPDHDHREDVAPEMVGAEPVRRRRRPCSLAAMSSARHVVGRPGERDERREHEDRRRAPPPSRASRISRRRSRGSTAA